MSNGTHDEFFVKGRGEILTTYGTLRHSAERTRELLNEADEQLDRNGDARTATATKVWKVECPCGTNWVYTEFASSLPDECENCGRQVEIMPGELAMDGYKREDLAMWLGVEQ